MIKSYKQYLLELGDIKEFKWEVLKNHSWTTYIASQNINGDEVKIEIEVSNTHHICTIAFTVNNNYLRQTLEDKNSLKILQMVISAVKDAWKKFIEPNKNIEKVHFTCASSRAKKLYLAFTKKIAKETGWEFYIKGDVFELWRPSEQTELYKPGEEKETQP